MDFGDFNLLFQVAHHWCGENDVTNGTKPNYEEFNHLQKVLEEEQEGQPVF